MILYTSYLFSYIDKDYILQFIKNWHKENETFVIKLKDRSEEIKSKRKVMIMTITKFMH